MRQQANGRRMDGMGDGRSESAVCTAGNPQSAIRNPKLSFALADVARVYASTPEGERRSFERDLIWHLQQGWVLSGPGFFIMFHERGDAWRVAMAAGRGALRALMGMMPYELPFLEWHRKGGTVFHRWETDKIRGKIYGLYKD